MYEICLQSFRVIFFVLSALKINELCSNDVLRCSLLLVIVKRRQPRSHLSPRLILSRDDRRARRCDGNSGRICGFRVASCRVASRCKSVEISNSSG